MVPTMAMIHKLRRVELETKAKHTDAEATYAIVTLEGKRFLQIDTYGSSNREFPGKQSQSIRFSRDALAQLREILAKEFGDAEKD